MKRSIEIVEVTTKAQQKEFVKYPLRLYKDNAYFVPPLFGDEMSIFTDKNVYYKTCESVFYLAKREGKTVGRIQGILQKQYNELKGVTQVRFSRFDAEDDEEVASALFDAVETWAKSKNASEVIGPLGYSDLEREGLLIEGFDFLSTFEEQYNYPYYQHLIEGCGYEKDVDWVEYRLYPEVYNHEKLVKFGENAMRRHNLHFADRSLPKKQFIKKYKDGIFACLDECYRELYGTVPFTEEMKKQMIDQFVLVINLDYLFAICDETEKVVAFGFGIPGFGKALQKSGGRLTPLTLINMLKLVKRPTSVDLALVGVLPKYQRSGLVAVMIAGLQDMLLKDNLEYMETNLNLEDNIAVQGQWKYFKHTQHKRRRAFIKKLGK